MDASGARTGTAKLAHKLSKKLGRTPTAAELAVAAAAKKASKAQKRSKEDAAETDNSPASEVVSHTNTEGEGAATGFAEGTTFADLVRTPSSQGKRWLFRPLRSILAAGRKFCSRRL